MRARFRAPVELQGTVANLVANGIEVRITAVLRTLADPRRVMYQAIREALDQLDLPQAFAEIPMRAHFQNAAGPVVTSAPDSLGAHAYREFAVELAT